MTSTSRKGPFIFLCLQQSQLKCIFRSLIWSSEDFQYTADSAELVFLRSFSHLPIYATDQINLMHGNTRVRAEDTRNAALKNHLFTYKIYLCYKQVQKKKEKKTTKAPNKSKTTHKIPATCLYKICIKLRGQSSVCGIVSSHLAISDLFLRNILIKKLQHQLWCFTCARTSSLVAQCNSLLRLWEHSPCCLILLMTEYESTSSSHPTFLYHMPCIKNAIIFF